MEAEADPLCDGGVNSRNGYRERSLIACLRGEATELALLHI